MKDAEAPEDVAPPALLMGAHGILAGWHGALGPVIARFDRYSQRRPRYARGLGNPGADLPSAPAIRIDGAVGHVAWCEEDGAWLARFDVAGGALSDARLALEGARRVAFGGPVLFGADALGIVALPLDEPDASRRVVSVRREGHLLDGDSLRGEPVLAFCHPKEPAWGVVAMPPGRDPVVVKHRLRARCRSIRLRAVGSRAAVMLGLEGDRVRLALVGQGAKAIERPHDVFARGTGPLRAPQVVWTDDRWAALAHDPHGDRLVVQPVGDKGVGFAFPRCEGPFAAEYFHKRFYALEVEPGAEGAELRLWRADRDGGRQQQRVVEVHPEDRAARRVARDVRFVLRGVAHRIETSADYRTQAPRPTLSRDGATLRMEDERGSLTLRARPAEEGGLRVRVASALGEGGDPGEIPSSLVRLARWIRSRWSAEERARAEAEERWARALAEGLGARVESVESAGNQLVLALLLAALPDPERLERWLRRLRDEQAELGRPAATE